MSQNEGDALLRSILENPDDDAPRLIYSDWLQEHGREWQASFIRLECEFANLEKLKDSPRRPADLVQLLTNVNCQVQTLWESRPETVDPWTVFEKSMPLVSHWDHCPSMISGTHKRQSVSASIRRGFVHSIYMSRELFLVSAMDFFSMHPIVDVVLSDVHPYNSEIWFNEASFPPDQDREADLPPTLFGRIEPQTTPSFARFRSIDDAFDALSNACVAYGRSLVNLPALGDEPIPPVV